MSMTRQQRTIKTACIKIFFFLAQVPALSDESFAGNLSGIAIKYKLIGVEELALMKENCFRSAQTKLIRMLTEYLNTKMNKDWDPDSVEQKYERNFIDNDADIISNARQVEGSYPMRRSWECCRDRSSMMHRRSCYGSGRRLPMRSRYRWQWYDRR